MKRALAALMLLFASQAIADYVCSPEQLRDRYKPLVPAKSSDAATACPPPYAQGPGTTCASPAYVTENNLDRAYDYFRVRNADGTTKEVARADGTKWTAEAFDSQGRPSLIRNPDGTTTTLSWGTTEIETREVDGFVTRYVNWKDGQPSGVETRGVGWVMLNWDEWRIGVRGVDTSGGGSVILKLGGDTAPSSPAQSGIASSAAALAAFPPFFIISFPVLHGPPMIAPALVPYPKPLEAKRKVLPIIEMAVTRVIDACTSMAQAAADKAKCLDEAYDKMRREMEACTDQVFKDRFAGIGNSEERYTKCIAQVNDTWNKEMRACHGLPPLP